MNEFNPRHEGWINWSRYDDSGYGITGYYCGQWYVRLQYGEMSIWNGYESIYDGKELPHDEVVRRLVGAGYRVGLFDI